MRVEHIFDLTRPHLESGRVDHVLLPVDDEQPPVLIHEPDISGVQLAIRDLLGRGLRIVEVAGDHLRPGDRNLSDFAGAHRLTVIIEDADHDVRLRQTTGEIPAVRIDRGLETVRHGGDLSAGLREAVALTDIDLRAVLESVDQSLRQRGPTGHEGLEGSELLRTEIRMRHHRRVDRGGAGHISRLLPIAQSDERTGFETVVEDEPGTAGHGCKELADEPGDVEERCQGDVAVAGTQDRIAQAVARIARDIRMTGRRSLRPSRGSGGIRDEPKIRGSRGARGEVGVEVVFHSVSKRETPLDRGQLAESRHCVEHSEDRIGTSSLEAPVITEHDEGQVRSIILDPVEISGLRDDESLEFGIGEDVFELPAVHGVERNDRCTGLPDPIGGDDESGGVLVVDADAIAGLDAVARQEGGERRRPAIELRPGQRESVVVDALFIATGFDRGGQIGQRRGIRQHIGLLSEVAHRGDPRAVLKPTVRHRTSFRRLYRTPAESCGPGGVSLYRGGDDLNHGIS